PKVTSNLDCQGQDQNLTIEVREGGPSEQEQQMSPSLASLLQETSFLEPDALNFDSADRAFSPLSR
ncbi:hypothetical protein PSY23_23370, partial [Shigella flexneri]|nr:hypothetical protein [Shigella flexneri]